MAQFQSTSILGDLTINGTITAQEFRSEFITNTIILESGSTQFGDSADDTHTFTGRLLVGTGIGNYESEFPSADASIHVHKTADGNGVPFGDESKVVISTGANTGGAQGYLGSLWFGTSDYPAAGDVSGTGDQFNWNAAGIASTAAGVDTGAGNVTSANLEFYTTDNSNTPSNRMVITSGGNVGIGTEGPSYKLHVDGGNAGSSFKVNGYVNGSAYGVDNRFTLQSGTRLWFYDSNVQIYRDTSTLKMYGNDSIVFETNTSERMRITSAGKVGIGTTTFPTTAIGQRELLVQGAIVSKPADTDDYYSYLKSNWSDDGAFELGIQGANINHKLITTSNYYFGTQLNFHTSDQKRMVIDTNGNVGIGYTSPSYKLDVQGSIRAREESPSLWLSDTNVANLQHRILGGGNAGLEYHADTSNVGAGYHRWDIGGGSSLMYLNESGNLGIGTTSPTRKLHIVDTNPQIKVSYGNATDPRYAELSWGGISVNADDSNNAFAITMNGGNSSSGHINFFTGPNGSPTEKMRITQSGNVGIGTASPSVKFHVQGAAVDNGSLGLFNNIYSAGGVYFPALKVVNAFSNHSYGTVAEFRTEAGSGTDRPSILFSNAHADHSWTVGQGGYGANDNFAISYRDFHPNTANGWGTARFVINTAGNVGIGTTSPDQKLHVFKGSAGSVGSNGNTIITAENSTNGYVQILVPSNRESGILFGNPISDADGGILFNSNVSRGLEFRTAGNSVKMVINDGGNVGIGTTSPSQKLHVDGRVMISSSSTSPGIQFQDVGTTNAYIDLVNGSQRFDFKNDATTTMSLVLNTGRVGIGTTSPSTTFSVANKFTANNDGVVSWGVAADHGRLTWDTNKAIVYGLSGKRLALGAGGTGEYMTIATDGNVGIGTTTPNAKLEVYGSGGTVLDIQGSQGQLFSVTDSLTGSLMSVNDISGLPILEVFDTDKVVMGEFGSNALVVTGSNVGVGTDAPTSNLHVNSAGGSGVVTQIKVTQEDDGAGHSGSAAILQSSGWGEAFLKLGGHQISAAGGDMNITSTSDLRIETGGTNTRMFITNTGNVGIGITNPTSKLHIAGFTTGAGLKMQYGNSVGTVEAVNFIANGSTNGVIGMQMVSAGVGDLWLGGSGGRSLTLYRDGNVGIGTTSPSYKLSVNGDIHIPQNEYIYFDNTAHYIRRGASNVELQGYNGLDLRTNGSSRLFIQQAGNVGIGTTSPEGKLDVVGSTIGGTAQSDWVNDGISYNDYGDLTISRRHGATKDSDWGFSGPLIDLRSSNAGSEWSVAQIMGTIDSFGGSNHSGGLMFLTSGGGTTDPTGRRTDGSAPQVRMGIGADGTTYIQGNVGIGTTSPIYRLDVESGSSSEAFGLSISGTERLKMYADSTWNYFEAKSGQNFRFSTTGGASFNILNGGNVGIGTTSPTAKLNIGSAYEDAFVLTDGRSAANTSTFDSSIVWDAFYSDAAKITLTHNDYNTSYRRLHFDIGGTELMSIKANGSVGIGTNNPNQHNWGQKALTVQATGTNGYSALEAYGTGTGSGAVLFGADSIMHSSVQSVNGSHLAFTTNASNSGVSQTERMRITSAGNVAIGTTTSSYKLTVQGIDNGINLSGTGAYLRWNSGDMQIKNEGSYKMGFHTYNIAAATLVNRMVIDTDGNIGIGTTTPDAKLTVQSDTADSTVLAIDGVNGRLFSVDDSLSDSLFSVNTIAGLPVIEAFADNTVVMGAYNQNDFVISDNKIGIGTDTPSYNLSIRSANGQYSDSSEAQSVFGLQYNTSHYFHTHRVGSSWQSIIENPAPGGSMQWHLTGSQKLTLLNSGNFGIGTTSPAETLHVSGSVRIDGAGTGTVQEQSGASPTTAYTTGDPSFYMGQPDRFLKIVIDGTAYIIPAYIPA